MTLADVAWPLDAGKRLRSEAMVRAVARLCDVDVAVLFADGQPDVCPLPPDIPARWVRVPPGRGTTMSAGLRLLTRGEPWESAVHDWAGVRRAVDSFGGPYDLVWFGALHHFARLSGIVRAPRMIVDCDDVETDKIDHLLDLPDGPVTGALNRLQRRIERPLWARIQRRAVAEADGVLVCSELDRSRLIEQAAKDDPAAARRVFAVANTYPDPGRLTRRAPTGSLTLAVVANYGTDQNLDAAFFAAEEILPALRREVPDARIRLIGRAPHRLTSFVGTDGLDVVGSVDDVADELSRAHAVLVPIRYGGGTRLKVLEAMAYGVPVLSTAVGAEGIDAIDGEHLLLAETGGQFVRIARRVVTEPGLADAMTNAARQLYERCYQPDAASVRIEALLNRLLGPQLEAQPTRDT